MFPEPLASSIKYDLSQVLKIKHLKRPSKEKKKLGFSFHYIPLERFHMRSLKKKYKRSNLFQPRIHQSLTHKIIIITIKQSGYRNSNINLGIVGHGYVGFRNNIYLFVEFDLIDVIY